MSEFLVSYLLSRLVQSKTVGRAATFSKVDSIVRETRAITNLVVRVVEICYNNAKKYNLDFSNVTGCEGKDDSAGGGKAPITDTNEQFGSR